MKVPKYIHQTWKTESVPYWLAKYVASWIKFNPKWEYVFWTDNDIEGLLSNKFPELIDVYVRLPINIMKIDLARYCIMKTYGGIYVDLDFECYKSIDSCIRDHDLILSWEWPGAKLANAVGASVEINIDNVTKHFYSVQSEDHTPDKPIYDHTLGNAMLVASADHPFWDHLISRISTYLLQGTVINSDVFRLTGPQFLTEQFIQNYEIGWNVKLLDNSWFYPIPWSKPSIDDGYRAINFPKSYGAHHWNGSWWQHKPDSENNCININDIVGEPNNYMVDEKRIL
jgi:mannosyltransferase OCH1-like enzyme